MSGPAAHQIESKETLFRALDELENRLALVRTKADTNNRPEMREKSAALIERVHQLKQELEKPNVEFQSIQRSTTEIIEDANSMERSAGTSQR